MIVLASASATRRAMLSGAGVSFAVDSANLDEEAVKQAMRGETDDAAQVAEMLAELKALQVCTRHPGIIVIGADQMLSQKGDWFDKPGNRDQAAQQLCRLRGQTHRLTSAVVAVRDGRVLWRYRDSADLTMRQFSDQWLAWYLDQAGDTVLQSVGAYQIEGPGSQLFARVQGDHFTILGLPLLAVLDFLRENGELLS